MPFFSFLCLFFLTCLLMYIGYWYPKKVYLGTNLPFTLLESSESGVLSSDSAKPVKKKFLYKHTPLVGSLLFTSLLQFSFLVFTQKESLGFFLIVWSICTILLTTTDCLYYLLPNTIIGTFVCIFFIYHSIVNPVLFSFYTLSGLFLFALLSLLFYLAPQSLGGGDVKLAGLIGFVFGYHKSLLAIFIACTFALFYSSIYFMFSKIKPTRTFVVPFGPFLFAGTWVIIIHTIFFP